AFTVLVIEYQRKILRHIRTTPIVGQQSERLLHRILCKRADAVRDVTRSRVSGFLSTPQILPCKAVAFSSRRHKLEHADRAHRTHTGVNQVFGFNERQIEPDQRGYVSTS